MGFFTESNPHERVSKLGGILDSLNHHKIGAISENDKVGLKDAGTSADNVETIAKAHLELEATRKELVGLLESLVEADKTEQGRVEKANEEGNGSRCTYEKEALNAPVTQLHTFLKENYLKAAEVLENCPDPDKEAKAKFFKQLQSLCQDLSLGGAFKQEITDRLPTNIKKSEAGTGISIAKRRLVLPMHVTGFTKDKAGHMTHRFGITVIKKDTVLHISLQDIIDVVKEIEGGQDGNNLGGVHCYLTITETEDGFKWHVTRGFTEIFDKLIKKSEAHKKDVGMEEETKNNPASPSLTTNKGGESPSPSPSLTTTTTKETTLEKAKKDAEKALNEIKTVSLTGATKADDSPTTTLEGTDLKEERGETLILNKKGPP